MDQEIKQFKLTTDDEIICEVLDWNEDGDVTIRHAYRIVHVEDPDKGYRYYYLRPFMVFQEDQLQILNSGHIVCEALPSTGILEYFYTAIQESKKILETRKNNKSPEIKDTKDILNEYAKELEEFKKALDKFDIKSDDEDDFIATVTASVNKNYH